MTADGVLWFAAKDGGPVTVHDVPLESTGSGPPKTESREYRGGIYVAVDRHGTLSVVNLVGETDLLSGLVPAEIFASGPMAALLDDRVELAQGAVALAQDLGAAVALHFVVNLQNLLYITRNPPRPSVRGPVRPAQA